VSTIIAGLNQVIKAYHARGFKIRHILGDREFEHTRKYIEKMVIMLNITS